MKRILAILFIVITQLSISQTNVISLRSHAGNMNNIDQETDNFGEPPWKMGVDTVIFVTKGVIVECGFNNRKDTLRSEVFTEELTDRIIDYYSPNCVFVGFKKSKHANVNQQKESKQNGFTWSIVIVFLLLLLNFRKNNSQFSKSFGSTFLLVISIFSATSIVAQTNVISLKSHTGDFATINNETDNFGGPAITLQPIDTVFFIKKGCIIEISHANYYYEGEHRSQDTLYSEIYDGHLTDRIKDNYSENCVFIGFKPSKNANIDKKHDSKKNEISWIAAIILGLMIFRFRKNNIQRAKSFGVIIVLVSMLYPYSITAQTNVISLKSHAGTLKNIHFEKDNFGNPPQSRIENIRINSRFLRSIDTVEFYKNKQVIEHFQDSETGLKITDTIVDVNFTKELTPYLQNRYPENTVFIGFKKQTMDAAKPFFAGMKKSGISLWIIVIVSLISISLFLQKTLS